MITIRILNRWNFSIIFQAELDLPDNAPQGIRLGSAAKAALTRGANLEGANLEGAGLLCAGNMRELRTMQCNAILGGWRGRPILSKSDVNTTLSPIGGNSQTRK
jgi:hypothetical protein